MGVFRQNDEKALLCAKTRGIHVVVGLNTPTEARRVPVPGTPKVQGSQLSPFLGVHGPYVGVFFKTVKNLHFYPPNFRVPFLTIL